LLFSASSTGAYLSADIEIPSRCRVERGCDESRRDPLVAVGAAAINVLFGERNDQAR
jgi:hypothetical protein